MYLYKLSCPQWDDYEFINIKSKGNSYFEKEKKYVDCFITIIKDLGYKSLTVKNLHNYEFMEYESFGDTVQPVSDESKRFYTNHTRKCIQKFPEKYTHSMRKLYSEVKEEMELDINQIIDVLKLKLRGNICYFILYFQEKMIVDFYEGYICIVSEKKIDNEIMEKVKKEEIILEMGSDDELDFALKYIEEF